MIFAGLLLVFAQIDSRGEEPATSVSLSQLNILPEEIVRQSQGTFDLEYVRKDAGWAKDILSRVDAARRAISRQTLDAFAVRIRIVHVPTHAQFVELVGNWAENSIGVAMSESATIVLNGEQVRVAPEATISTVLVHEFAHLYLGVRCTGDLPRWLNEGLAMAMAGEWNIEDTASLVMTATVGQLIPVRNLQTRFPVQADQQRLAYRQSYSLTNYLMRETADESLANLIAQIRGKEGEERLRQLWNPLHRDAIEIAWQKSLRSKSNWILFGFSSGVIWMLIMVLAFVAWGMRKWRSRALRAEWNEEEEIYAALDEEEEKIWGDEVETDDPSDGEEWKRGAMNRDR